MFSNARISGAIDDALAYLAPRAGEATRLTQRLIAAPSENLPGDETAPAAVMRDAIAAVGLPAAVEFAKEPHRPNLIVRIDGAHPGRHLAICGHLDTKPVGEAGHEWNSDPFTGTIVGDRMFGLGSTDMKGACAAMLLAGAAFNAVREQASGSLSLVFTADEEYGSHFGAKYLTEIGAIDADAILLGEPAGVHEDWEAIRTVSRGFSGFRVVVGGTQTHSSISDQMPTVSAVEAMAKVITGLRRELHPRFPDHPLCPNGPTVNIGVRAFGGVGYGVLAGHGEIWSDIRTTPGMTQGRLAEDIEAALSRIRPEVPGATVTWAFHESLGWIEPTEVPADHPMVAAIQDASGQILGVEVPLGPFPGATDAYAFHGIGGIPTLAAWGPGMLPLAHGPNEFVSVSALEQTPAIYAITALLYGAA